MGLAGTLEDDKSGLVLGASHFFPQGTLVPPGCGWMQP